MYRYKMPHPWTNWPTHMPPDQAPNYLIVDSLIRMQALCKEHRYTTMEATARGTRSREGESDRWRKRDRWG